LSIETPESGNPEASGTGGSQLGLWAQLTSFSVVFWICNTMEMFERLAYYGLRTVLPIYMVLAVEEGGPEFDHIQKGSIYGIWASVQSFLPIVAGGYADKYGYKLTIAISIAVKIVGYLVMAFAVDLAILTSAGASGSVPGHMHTYNWFLLGAVALAAGTAIFKPGIQGIIALQLNKDNDSVGWSVFYQLVNVGGFLGPFLAGVMRLMAWKWVFVSCAAVVALNYFLLLMFTEPGVRKGWEGIYKEARLFSEISWDSAIGICEPRLMSFLVVFSGFWMMFYQLFDLLPNYIDDWVDSSMVYTAFAAPVFAAFGSTPPEEWGGMIPQEMMININAGMCMLFAFLIGFVTGKVRSMVAMVIGILIAAFAIWGLGYSTNGWMVLGFIALFSLGELSASPTKMRYFSAIAPPEKKGLYLGYINATVGIGWALGSAIAGEMYQTTGDKVVLARKYLVEELGQSASVITELKKTDVLPKLAELTSNTDDGVRELLYNFYDPSAIWAHFALLGVVSMVGLMGFDLITRMKHRDEPFMLIVLTFLISAYTYGFGWAAVFSGAMCFFVMREAWTKNTAA
jgi:dipeptide/tripeptide permease